MKTACNGAVAIYMSHDKAEKAIKAGEFLVVAYATAEAFSRARDVLKRMDSETCA